MLCRNILPLFAVLAVGPLAAVNGGLRRELRRKLRILWHGKPPVPDGPVYEGCNLCKFGPCTPIIQPSDDDKGFDGTADATAYNTVLDGPRHEITKRVSNILINRSAVKRTAIANVYSKNYKMTPREALQNRVNSFFWHCIFLGALTLPMPEFFAAHFQYAMERQGEKFKGDKDERDQNRVAIIEMLLSLPKCLIDEIVNKYNAIEGKDFFQDLNKALESGGMPQEYRDFVIKQSGQEGEVNGYSSWIKALLSAYKLKSAVESQDVTAINQRVSELFTKETNSQIIETLTVYENLRHGRKGFISLEKDMDKFMASANEVYIIWMKLFMNKPLYFAKTLESIFKNNANKYAKRFIYLLRGRFDIDLQDILDAYNKEEGKRFEVDYVAWGKKGDDFGLFNEVMQEVLKNK